jgi:hypothetical protein
VKAASFALDAASLVLFPLKKSFSINERLTAIKKSQNLQITKS